MIAGRGAALAPGRAAVAVLDGASLAFTGELSGKVREYYDIEEPAAICETDLDLLYSRLTDKINFVPIPRFPKVLRDMAVVVDKKVLWQELLDEIQGLDISLLRSIDLFDSYSGKQLPPEKKSLAFSLEFQSRERTLTGEEVDELVGKIVSHLKKKFGARLRK